MFFLWYSGYAKQEADKIVLKSRYTYSVDIDSSGNVVDRNTQYTTNTSEQAVDFSEITINKMADIVTKSHENIGQLAKNEKDFKRHMSVINYYTCFKHAPVVIIVYSCEYKMIEYKILKENNAPQEVLDILVSPQSAAQGIGAAVENILLAATEMGYGTCYMTGPTHAKKEIEELIGFEKEGYELMSMISLGVAEDDTPKQPPRKPLEEVVTFID